MQPSGAAYPATFTFDPPEKVTNWRPLVNWLLAIPHFAVLYALRVLGQVIGLLSWFYLLAQITILCAEINVVKVEHLWPRSLQQPPLSDADQRTMEKAAKAEERVDQERVEVEFDPSARTRERPPPPGDRQQAS